MDGLTVRQRRPRSICCPVCGRDRRLTRSSSAGRPSRHRWAHRLEHREGVTVAVAIATSWLVIRPTLSVKLIRKHPSACAGSCRSFRPTRRPLYCLPFKRRNSSWPKANSNNNSNSSASKKGSSNTNYSCLLTLFFS